MRLLIFLILFSLQGTIPQNRTASIFEKQEVVATLKSSVLKEASGLAKSVKNEGYLWSHNDSGGDPSMYLLNLEGEIVMEARLEGVSNRDWEEIAIVSEEEGTFLYVAEMGDNKAVRNDLSIIKFPEPTYVGSSSIRIPTDSLEIMPFEYTEGPRDAEALMFDPYTNELVIVTKREERSMVYSFPFQPGKKRIGITSKGTLPSRNFTASDTNESGEILLKNYDSIFYWNASERPIAERLLDWNPEYVPYEPEPQGEAICWYGDDFYTLSEKAIRSQELFLFKRK